MLSEWCNRPMIIEPAFLCIGVGVKGRKSGTNIIFLPEALTR